MPPPNVILGIIVLMGMALAVVFRKLTLAAALTGGVVATCIFLGAGFTGIAMLATFFLLGTLATSWKKETKRTIQPNETHDSRRTVGQVLANGGVAALAAVMAWFLPAYCELFCLMIAASLASATADTLSSELGMVYGRMFFNILTFKKDERGKDGVISIEGLLIGIAGSAVIALIYASHYGFSYKVLVIIIVGTIGNITDSLLGATLERKRLIGNNTVNFLNTVVAALAVLLLV